MCFGLLLIVSAIIGFISVSFFFNSNYLLYLWGEKDCPLVAFDGNVADFFTGCFAGFGFFFDCFRNLVCYVIAIVVNVNITDSLTNCP